MDKGTMNHSMNSGEFHANSGVQPTVNVIQKDEDYR